MKRIFPVLWLVVVAIAFLAMLTSAPVSRIPPIALAMPPIMMVFGFLLFRRLVWDLADEVEDGGTFLLVRKHGEEERLSFADIMNVSMSQYTRPPRLSLRLRKPGKFGDEIVFIPKLNFTLKLFARNPVAESLMRRADQARQEETR